ncbi:carboxypeptidase S [Dentipellis sp. KUC8613]|nr:carboxypeptidase S [Dentipellis sp. KUC8613]
MGIIVLASLYFLNNAYTGHFTSTVKHRVFGSGDEELCPQVDALYPDNNGELWKSLGDALQTDEFRGRAVDWLGGAVRIPTESHDKMLPVGEDPRWDVFIPFQEYLQQAFPLVHSNLTLTKVNTYGLVYHWKGSDDSLKPLLLAAHQDVVPVNPTTADEWTFPPFSGHYDGERLWGRGSSDDKSGLIGILSSVESLLEKSFQPNRSIVLAFGFDEEVSGLHGARHIGKWLFDKYGKDAFAMLVDEGGGFGTRHGSIFANVGVGEKGYIDTRIEVTSPGGHSSVPPAHTSIGILSQLLVHFESKPIKSHLERATPMYGTAQCFAAHGKDFPRKLGQRIQKSLHSDKALRKAEKGLFKLDPSFENLAGSTQAIDLIQGGVKTNALPEQAWAVVNHRIATQSSVAAVQDRDTDLLRSLSKHFNLSYTAFGNSISPKDAPAYGTLTLSDAWGTALNPAPITPTDADAIPYRILSGTIKATYDSHRNLDGGNNIVVSPGIMSGNTDTRYYWDLTSHIFRYNHHNSGEGGDLSNGVHTVNEFIRVDDFVEMIRFFTALILNADEAKDL